MFRLLAVSVETGDLTHDQANERNGDVTTIDVNQSYPIGMPKANLRVLKSPSGPFHKGECSVCREKFYVSPGVEDFKADMFKQFDAHLFYHHRRQWDAQQRKLQQ